MMVLRQTTSNSSYDGQEVNANPKMGNLLPLMIFRKDLDRYRSGLTLHPNPTKHPTKARSPKANDLQTQLGSKGRIERKAQREKMIGRC